MGFFMIFQSIAECTSCSLCNNQKPVLQKNVTKASVFWVGLSAVKNSDLFDNEPLSSCTNTGKLIAEIEGALKDLIFYRTNAVKCLPLDEAGKIRYPSSEEMQSCFKNIMIELQEIKPAVVVLLGKKVSQFFLKQFNFPAVTLDKEFCYSPTKLEEMLILSIHHPSYVQIYKKNMASKYVELVSNAILDAYLESDLH